MKPWTACYCAASPLMSHSSDLVSVMCTVKRTTLHSLHSIPSVIHQSAHKTPTKHCTQICPSSGRACLHFLSLLSTCNFRAHNIIEHDYYVITNHLDLKLSSASSNNHQIGVSISMSHCLSWLGSSIYDLNLKCLVSTISVLSKDVIWLVVSTPLKNISQLWWL